jgi:hypothetical protein
MSMIQRLISQFTGGGRAAGRRGTGRRSTGRRATTGGRNAMIGAAVGRFLRSRR